jgi:origin recognition complex subunit 3
MNRQFEVLNSEELLERIFCVTVIGGDITFRIGAELSNVMLRRQRHFVQSPNDFIDALQYAHMSHFYANPLSIFLKEDMETWEEVGDQTMESLRCTRSFRKLVEKTMREENGAARAKQLLESDQYLFEKTVEEVGRSMARMDKSTRTVELLHLIRTRLGISAMPFSSLYLLNLSGRLIEAPTLREPLLALKKADSDSLQTILSSIAGHLLQCVSETNMSNESSPLSQLHKFSASLTSLLDESPPENLPLRSKYAISKSTLRTTVVAQKVQLSSHSAQVTTADSSYSQLLDSLHDWLYGYFQENLVAADEVLFSEVFVFDGKGADRAAFAPRHRGVIERALERPGDYLGCECCVSDKPEEVGEVRPILKEFIMDANDWCYQTVLSSSLPPTALLYRLYLESGSSINVADLWTAFKGVMVGAPEEDEDKEEEAEQAMQVRKVV